MKGFGDQMFQKENRHKGILAAAAAVLVLILCGCQGGGAASSEPEVFSIGESLLKSQEIAVLPEGTDETPQVLRSEEEIASITEELRISDGKKAVLPEGAEKSGIFCLRQTETLKLGQRAEDRKMKEICRICVYRSLPYVTLKIAGLEMTFSVGEETAAYLNSYFM